MWINLKIGMFYGAPILAVLLAVVWFVVLILRVRRGGISKLRAVLLYACTLLLPVLAVLLIGVTSEIAGYVSSSAERFSWDAALFVDLLLGLLPLGLYVGAVIVGLQVLFWIVLSLLLIRA
jgi:hypothetical protein